MIKSWKQCGMRCALEKLGQNMITCAVRANPAHLCLTSFPEQFIFVRLGFYSL